ncbi:MAG TPA: serine protease [Polyangiales bacterium]
MAALCAGCQSSSPPANDAPIAQHDQPIVGGKPARPSAYPWMVALFELYESKPYFMCGGTLLDATHVLTAAHCSLSTRLDQEKHQFVTNPTDPAQVRVARRPQSISGVDDEDVIEVRNVIVHPQFGGWNADYDVAVWELEEPVELSEYPRLVRHPLVQELLSAVHTPARVLGYGALGEEEPDADRLMQVDVPLVSRERCRLLHAEGNPGLPPEELITDRMICAGYRAGGRDACYGDSGGPLLLPSLGKAPLLAGVVSWGSACAAPNLPGVYANVSVMADYIGACQDGNCETRAPERECDWGYEDCDGDFDGNGCELLSLSPAACAWRACGAPTCGDKQACIVTQEPYCAPAKPVVPSVHCVIKEPDEFGDYLAVFGLDNQNEGSLQVPLADHRFPEGGEWLLIFDVIPPGFMEAAVLVLLDEPAGTYSVRGPDGVERSVAITADTPDCRDLPEPEPANETVARLANQPGWRVHDSLRARLAGLRATHEAPTASKHRVDRPADAAQ